jgi:hypothetical protein
MAGFMVRSKANRDPPRAIDISQKGTIDGHQTLEFQMYWRSNWFCGSIGMKLTASILSI